MKLPKVVRLKRRGGVVVQDCDVYIGRECKMGGWDLPESKWANPFSVKKYTREIALQKYEEYILSTPSLLESLGELEGKRLGCWCSPEPCHGNIIIKLFRMRCNVEN